LIIITFFLYALIISTAAEQRLCQLQNHAVTVLHRYRLGIIPHAAAKFHPPAAEIPTLVAEAAMLVGFACGFVKVRRRVFLHLDGAQKENVILQNPPVMAKF
jgi:hypothetical protein